MEDLSEELKRIFESMIGIDIQSRCRNCVIYIQNDLQRLLKDGHITIEEIEDSLPLVSEAYEELIREILRNRDNQTDIMRKIIARNS